MQQVYQDATALGGEGVLIQRLKAQFENSIIKQLSMKVSSLIECKLSTWKAGPWANSSVSVGKKTCFEKVVKLSLIFLTQKLTKFYLTVSFQIGHSKQLATFIFPLSPFLSPLLPLFFFLPPPPLLMTAMQVSPIWIHQQISYVYFKTSFCWHWRFCISHNGDCYNHSHYIKLLPCLFQQTHLLNPSLIELSLRFYIATASWLNQVALAGDSFDEMTSFKEVEIPLPTEVCAYSRCVLSGQW